ncbi:MAG: hypothetical protein IT236_00215 [Bacteroidia bacterium]|nr:hypothetical protein [Bacteroidia bacterium]
MKKYFLFPALALAIISCKKDRVCNCTITVQGTTISRTQTLGLPPLLNGTDTTITQPLFTINSEKKTYNKVREKDMRKTCFSTSSESINQSSNNVVPGIYTITTTQTGTKTYDCKIE